ncbi:MAG TPA: DnaB-like helicase C-terminal domain-containing protein [Gemmatimonadaceae bacterium]
MARSPDISPLSVLLSRVDAVGDGSSPTIDTIGCGFPSVDKALGGGFRRTDLTVLGGDVGSGKSSLALAMAIRAAMAGTRVAFFSSEMTRDRLLERVIAIEGRVKIEDLRRGDLDDVERASAGAVAVRLRHAIPLIERLPLGGVPLLTERLSGMPEFDLLVVDGLPGFARGSRALEEELAAAVRELKTLALDRDAAILTTAQLPALSARPDRRPVLDDFGALGAVKQHADVVLGLFREDMYEPARDIAGATELLIRKNRNGATGYVDLYFYAQWMRFEDMLDPDR